MGSYHQPIKYQYRKNWSAYGGDLLKTRAGRRHGRPISTRHSMHLVLRSTKAKGERSFLKPRNNANVRRILRKFSTKYQISVMSFANVGNHLHIQLRFVSRRTYKAFIRAVTGAIAMAIMGLGPTESSFWDRRPYTRIVGSLRDFKNVSAYIRMNVFEGLGYSRDIARKMVRIENKLRRRPVEGPDRV